MLKRRIGRAMVAFAIAGIGALGLSTPAHATEDKTVTYENICGGVEITAEGADYIEVLRNGVKVGTTYDEVSLWGASPGDDFTVLGSDATHEYWAPEDCYTGHLTMVVEHACHGVIVLRVNNDGQSPVSGFMYGEEELDPFPVGVTVLELSGADGPYQITRNTGTGDLIWHSAYYTEPRECESEPPHVTFTDLCSTVKIYLTSGTEETQEVRIKKNGELIDTVLVPSGTPVTKEYDAVAGDEFTVYYKDVDEYEEPEVEPTAELSILTYPKYEKIAEHTYTPQDCELPVTGTKVGTVVLWGLLLIVGGAALHVASRRTWAFEA